MDVGEKLLKESKNKGSKTLLEQFQEIYDTVKGMLVAIVLGHSYSYQQVHVVFDHVFTGGKAADVLKMKTVHCIKIP